MGNNKISLMPPINLPYIWIAAKCPSIQATREIIPIAADINTYIICIQFPSSNNSGLRINTNGTKKPPSAIAQACIPVVVEFDFAILAAA